jgi:hypothetical protein
VFIGATDQSCLSNSRFGRCGCSYIGEETSRINNQNRLSVRPDSVYERSPPGQTAQRFISSCGAGDEVTVQITAVNDRQACVVGKDIGDRKNKKKHRQRGDQHDNLSNILPHKAHNP